MLPYVGFLATLGVGDDPAIAPPVSDERSIGLPATMTETVSISWVTLTFQQRRQTVIGEGRTWLRHDPILSRRPRPKGSGPQKVSHDAGRARCRDDQRAITVHYGSIDVRDQRIRTSRSSGMDQYRCFKLVNDWRTSWLRGCRPSG